MAGALRGQAERLYRVFVDLIRAYQFRDRDRICCHGLSVSQCYALDALDTQGPMTMGDLAGHLHLEISTMTRVVDDLVTNRLAARAEDARDRRVCRVRISRRGQSLLLRIRDELIKEHELVLRQIPSESREAVIKALSHLLSAFKGRQRCVSGEPDCRQRQARRVG